MSGWVDLCDDSDLSVASSDEEINSIINCRTQSGQSSGGGAIPSTHTLKSTSNNQGRKQYQEGRNSQNNRKGVKVKSNYQKVMEH